MSTYKRFQTDKSIETSGIWVDYGEAGRYKIARAGGGNKAYLRSAEAFRRKYRTQIDLDIMSNEAALAAAIEIYAESILLDWEDVTGPDGEPLEFTRENVVRVFTDLPDLFSAIQGDAMNAQLFRRHVDEIDAKN